MKKAKYICFEGLEGTGKTTQIALLKEYLTSKGFSVIVTKEPGTKRVPITLELRKIALDQKYDSQLNGLPREFIFQSIRGIHLNSDIYPNLYNVDYIIQDRGILSGLALGETFGFNQKLMMGMNNAIVSEKGEEFGITSCFELYDKIIYLETDSPSNSLEIAKNAKKEFENGDAIENKGANFMTDAQKKFHKYIDLFNKNKKIAFSIQVQENKKFKDKEQILKEIIELI